jgi:carbamoyl-phosphate synthase large subunit
MKNKRIFISGGAGVIGRELVSILQSMGANLFVGDLKPRPKEFASDISYRQGDLNDLTSDELLLFEPEIFIHLAATFERTTETYEFWHDNFLHNVKLSHHLSTIIKDSSTLKKIIFASSYLIYNEGLYNFKNPQLEAVSLKESDPIQPRNLTGSAKLIHEIELDFLRHFKSDSYAISSVRIFRGYGRGSHCVISRWIRAALAGESISVFKKEGLFDYIFAGDIAQGLVNLSHQAALPEIVNLGNGNARKVADVVDCLKSHFPDLVVNEGGSDIDFEASQADMTLYEDCCNWVPPRQIEDAIPLMIEYEKKVSDDSEVAERSTLISSASQKVPLVNAVKKAAMTISSTRKVVGGDLDAKCISSFITDNFWAMPRLDNLSMEALISKCKELHIDTIVPTRDKELLFFSQASEKLRSNGIDVMVSSEKAISLCLDKLAFYKDTASLNLPIIPTFASLAEAATTSDVFVVKERYGAGGDNLAINVDRSTAEAFSKKLESPIYQPYISGDEVSVDMYIDKQSNLKGVVMRRRDVVINGESKVTTTFFDPELKKCCEAFVKGFDFYGHTMIQAIREKNGAYQIIECNPRFGGASTLSIAAGLNSFYWFLLEANGVNVESYPFINNPKINLQQIRYSHDQVKVIDGSNL